MMDTNTEDIRSDIFWILFVFVEQIAGPVNVEMILQNTVTVEWVDVATA